MVGNVSQSVNDVKPSVESIRPLGSAYCPTVALISVHGDPAAELGRDGAGGQNLYVRTLGMALAQRGCQVDMFTRREDPTQPTIVEHGPNCRTIRLDAGPAQFIHRDDLFEHLPAFVQAWLAFQQETQRVYDVIHSNYWLSGWVGLQLRSRLGIPQVHTYHSIGAIKYQTMQEKPTIAETRLVTEWACLEQVDRVIATSVQEEADLRAQVSQQGHIQVIPCGIDAQKFSQFTQAAARHHLGIPQEVPMVLYVGRFDRRKGIETLVQASAMLQRNFRLYLVGGSRAGGTDDTEQQHIRSLVEELGLTERVTFTGPVPHGELPPYYAAADLCVVPSYYEPFGLVAIEAMAAATPVIASQVGGLQYSVVSGETGLLVPPREPADLAMAIQTLLEDPKRSRQMGEAGWKRVQAEFSQAAVAAKVHHLYNLLITAQKTYELPGSEVEQRNLN